MLFNSRSFSELLTHSIQIVASADSTTFAAERAEVLIQETARLGLRTRQACLAHLGRSFRPVCRFYYPFIILTRAHRSLNPLLRDLIRKLASSFSVRSFLCICRATTTSSGCSF